MGTLTFGADSVAYDAPSRASKRVSDRVDGTERLYEGFSAIFSLAGRSRGNDGSRLRRRRWARSSGQRCS